MSQPIIVVLNPQSGSSDDEFRARIEKALQERGVEFQIRETDPEEGAMPVVRDAVGQGATHILACGGDGTVMSAVNGLARLEPEPKTLLSIVPGGTANLLAQALDIPDDAEEAVAVALDGRDRLIDLGQCGEEFFALGLGMGLTERLVSGASAREKEVLGRLAYAKAMLAELGQKPHGLSYRLDGGKWRRTRGVGLVVANAGEISGKWKFAPDAKMDDGKLDLCLLHRFYLRDLVRLLCRGILGTMAEDRSLSFYQAREIDIRTDPPLDVQIDGEEVDARPPLTISVRPKALKVRVPLEQKEE